MKKTLFTIWCVAALFVGACEKEPSGLVDSHLSAPRVVSVSLRDSSLNLDTTRSPSVLRVDSLHYQVSDSISAYVADVNGLQTVSRVSYRIYKPGSSDNVSTGVLTFSSADSSQAAYHGKASFTIMRIEAGPYIVEVSVVDAFGLPGSSYQTTLYLTRRNSIPVVVDASVPDTVYLPPGDSLLIPMTATVSDSDGLSDINQVYFHSLSSTDTTRKFILLDDGGANSLSGDLLAGDGIYTIVVLLRDQGNVRRTFTFSFYAEDNEGAISQPLLRTLTVR